MRRWGWEGRLRWFNGVRHVPLLYGGTFLRRDVRGTVITPVTECKLLL